MSPLGLELMRGSCLLAVGLSLALACHGSMAARDSAPVRLYFRYAARIDRSLRLLFLDTKARHVVLGQAACGLLCVALAAAQGAPGYLLGLAPVAVGPSFALERMRQKRVALIEQKLDVFVAALANALRAAPSPGRALAAVQPITPAPLDQEIELVLREMRVGSTLEQALLNLSARVRSFQLDAAMSALLIGHQTGGNVPEILDRAAATLREMARLAGVMRAKTADARTQANVLTVFPAGIVLALDWASPGYFDPLSETPTGMAIALTAVAMWVVAVVMVRRIMEAEL